MTGYCCTNIFSEHAKELLEFYRKKLGIPFIRTDGDHSTGVYLGFIELDAIQRPLFSGPKHLAFCPAFCYTELYLFLVRRPAGGLNRNGQFVQRNLKKSPYTVFWTGRVGTGRDGKELEVTDG